MKTRKIIIALALMMSCSVNANAQLGGLLNKIKQKVKEKVEQKIDRSTKDGIDAAESKVDNTSDDAVKGKANDNSLSASAVHMQQGVNVPGALKRTAGPRGAQALGRRLREVHLTLIAVEGIQEPEVSLSGDA